jgi:hypothetical protein
MPAPEGGVAVDERSQLGGRAAARPQSAQHLSQALPELAQLVVVARRDGDLLLIVIIK